MSLKQRKSIFLKKIKKIPVLDANRFLALEIQESISKVVALIEKTNKLVGIVLVVAFVVVSLFVVAPAALQELTLQLIKTYQHSFIDSNTNSREALPVSVTLVVGLLSLCGVFGVALISKIQNRDYTVKNKDKIYIVYDKMWNLFTKFEYRLKPYMSFNDALALYKDFTRTIMGAGSWRLKKEWLSIESVFIKFFSTQETLNNTEKNKFYDCMELMDKQINGFTPSSLRKTIIDKFLK